MLVTLISANYAPLLSVVTCTLICLIGKQFLCRWGGYHNNLILSFMCTECVMDASCLQHQTMTHHATYSCQRHPSFWIWWRPQINWSKSWQEKSQHLCSCTFPTCHGSTRRRYFKIMPKFWIRISDLMESLSTLKRAQRWLLQVIDRRESNSHRNTDK